MIKLFLQPNDIPELTSFSGNIDIDQLKPIIHIAQTTFIKRILGNDLYDKIYTDLSTLSGDYLKIFNDYVVPMTAFYTVSTYLSLSVTKVTEQGAFKRGVEGSTNLTTPELNSLGDSYKSIAVNYELNFRDYMKTISIAEWSENEKIKESTNLIQWY